MMTATHPEWRETRKAIEERIALLHLELEMAYGMEHTHYLRGEIAGLRWLIGEVEPQPVPLTPVPGYNS